MYNRFESLNRAVSNERNNNPEHPLNNKATTYSNSSSAWLNKKNGDTFWQQNGQRSNYYDNRTK